MGEIILAAIGWLAATAIALGALVFGHDVIAALALAAAASTTLLARHLLRRAEDAPPSSLVDGIEALGVAAVGITIAATSGSPSVICACAAIAFAAVVQQYATLVYAHITRRRDALVGAPMGLAVLGGVVVYLLLGRPPAVVIALAAWAIVECVWSSLVRGYTIAHTDRSLVRPPVLPKLEGRARWLRLGEGLASSRDPAFWGLVVARPIARIVLQLVVEQRWITPNRITLASIACCFGAAALIATGGSIALAIVLVGVRSVLDSMDGQLARYRACGSNFGSYLDKVSDLFAWGALLAALGVRAYAHTPSKVMLLLPLAAAILLAISAFSLWLARSLVPTTPSTTPHARLGGTAWAKSLWRIVLFEEPDFYLWIALALATARYDVFVPFIAAAYAARALGVVVHRALGWLSLGKESPA
ncbi:MAG: CDP-alcohol phosphatidyltransferase family protein [Myxococcota bacterium]|nr:CDP-alcohol phosphatidyltransferase family protein [Myxococcota bacterium]